MFPVAIMGLLLVAVLVVFVLFFLFAVIAPRRSIRPQRKAEHALASGEERTSERGPGRLGAWLAKPFSKSREGVAKSGEAGRKSRSKLPF